MRVSNHVSGFAVDHGFRTTAHGTEVRTGLITVMAAIAMAVIVLAVWANRTAVYRLGRRSEDALFDLRVRLFEHIHRLSLADHSEERKGALTARVTSDVETMQQFFQWGAVAWLIDGTLMVLVAAVMLAYDWVLAVVAFAPWLAQPFLGHPWQDAWSPFWMAAVAAWGWLVYRLHRGAPAPEAAPASGTTSSRSARTRGTSRRLRAKSTPRSPGAGVEW